MSEAVVDRPATPRITVPETRLHPIYLLITTANTLRSAIPFLVVTVLGGAPIWVNIALFVLIMIIAIAQWYVRKYSVTAGVLRIRAGLVNRTERLVPITRITALVAHRSWTQRLVGVWGLKIQSPGDSNGSVISMASLSSRRLTELRAALETQQAGTRRRTHRDGPAAGGRSPANLGAAGSPTSQSEVLAVLGAREMLIAAVTNSLIPLLFAAGLVIWVRFSSFIPSRPKSFMDDTVAPRGWVAVVVALIVAAIVAGVIFSALRLHRFTLVRDGDMLRNVRGLLSKQSGSFAVDRIQAVRIVEGSLRGVLGYCALQVEVAGIGRANTNQRMMFPLIRTQDAGRLIARAIPELQWSGETVHPIPQRIHRRYLTIPLEYGAGFTLLALFLPGWWTTLAVLPLPLAYWLGVARAKDGGWQLNDETVVLRWRRVLLRNTVVARRHNTQMLEWSSSPWKAKAGVAGFTMRFSSGRSAKVRYLADPDALTLLHAVGRPGALPGRPHRHVPAPVG